jgi:hypothetical protein
MSVSGVFNSIGHFFAKAVKTFLVLEPKIAADAQKVLNTKPEVTAITAIVPKYGLLAVGVEDLGYALIGELLAVLKAGGAAAEAKLADLGLDQKVVDSVKAVAADPTIQKVAKLL